MASIDAIIVSSLRRFLHEVESKKWRGRERDAVSLFAFGALLHELKHGLPRFDARQIGIEVALNQGFKRPRGGKERANKDLVIWRKPFSTAWSGGSPLAVLEWKVDSEEKSASVNARELKTMRSWLTSYLARNRATRGYGFHLQLHDGRRPTVVSVSRFANGKRSGDLRDMVVENSD